MQSTGRFFWTMANFGSSVYREIELTTWYVVVWETTVLYRIKRLQSSNHDYGFPLYALSGEESARSRILVKTQAPPGTTALADYGIDDIAQDKKNTLVCTATFAQQLSPGGGGRFRSGGGGAVSFPAIKLATIRRRGEDFLNSLG